MYTKRLVFLYVLLLSTMMGICQTKKIDGITYKVISSTEVAVYNAKAKDLIGNIVIPSTVQIKKNDYDVTSIGESAFSYCLGLTSIDIPKSVTSIGEYAFFGCDNLTSITIPEGVRSIGRSTFRLCKSLESISIPGSVIWIAGTAFLDCSSLEEVTFKDGKEVLNIGFIEYTNSSEMHALFSECPLKKVYIGRNLSYKNKGYGDDSPFSYEKSKLHRVVIGEGVTSLEEGLFYECDWISITIPSSVISIASGALPYHLSSVTISGSAYQRFYELFRNKYGIRFLTITDGLTEIKGDYFQKFEHLAELSIPNSVKYIEEGAFSACKALEKLIVPDFAAVESGFSLKGLDKLVSIQGHNNPYPRWILKGVSNYSSLGKQMQRINMLYSYYAYDRIYELMLHWQAKKDYETSIQWQARITEEARIQYLEFVQKQVMTEFIELRKPNTLKSIPGEYDEVYEVYSILVEDLGSFYLKVPQTDVHKIKSRWEQAKIIPTYGVIDDKLAVISAEVRLDGKVYRTADRYNDELWNIAVNLPPLQINLNEETPQSPSMAIDKTIDQNIPIVNFSNDNTFAVIIGNEDYREVDNVPYALNDATIFATYCHKTLGLPEKNVKLYENATYGTILSAIENIQNISTAYKGDINVIFYYAGHGVPDEGSNKAYLLPIDANGRNSAVCYSIDKLYEELNELEAKQVIVFLDACFSGAKRGEGMLASARGVAIKAKQSVPQGNMVVFSAASADETAYPYEEKVHGLFTYYLLKKLNETKGDVTLGDLGDYICEKVAQEAVVTNGKMQTPTIVPSATISENWRNMKLR